MKTKRVMTVLDVDKVLEMLEQAGLIKQGNGKNYFETDSDGDLVVTCEDCEAL